MCTVLPALKFIVNEKLANAAIKRLGLKMPEAVKRVLQLVSLDAQKYLRTERMTGGTNPRQLAVRSGKLRSSVRPLSVRVRGSVLRAGVNIGSRYATTHIGPRGSSITIRPKNKKWLTIPLSSNVTMTKAGVLRGGATSGAFGSTFIVKSKAGNLIIFGQKRIQKGKNAGNAAGRITPLFVLKKSVTIRRRIATADILDRMRKQVIALAKQELRR